MNMIAKLAVAGFALGLVAPVTALAQSSTVPWHGTPGDSKYKAGDRVHFVSCPMIRDTYVPAWLARNENELFYLTAQGDLGSEVYPPQLSHQVLVEGVVKDGSRISGGLVLSPVTLSVLPELDESCNTILPASGHANPPHDRSPGPSNTEEEAAPPRTPVNLPTNVPAEFSVPYAFDVGDHLYSKDSRVIGQAAAFYRNAKPKKVELVAYRTAAKLSNGKTLTERSGVAEQRAAMIERMLIHAGVAPEIITSQVKDVSQQATGVDDYKLRRVMITITP